MNSTSSTAAKGPAFQRSDFVCAIVIAIVACVVGTLCVFSRPDLFQSDEVLIVGEAGNALYRAELIGQGKVFYAEIASQYGVLGSYLFAGLCSVIGVSGYALAFHNVWLSSIAIGLLFLAARTVTTVQTALLYIAAIAGWVFVYPITPFGIGAYGHIEYISVEKLLVVLICLVAALPQRWTYSFATGCLLGLMQTNKFGLAIYFGLGIAICEVAFWLFSRRAETFSSIASRAAVSCLGFVAIQVPFAALLYFLLPHNVAIEAIWPTWILESYPANLDWMTFDKLLGGTVTEYVTQRLVIFTALFLTIGMIIRVAIGMFRRPCDDLKIRRSSIILLAPGVCFLIGFGSFLAHEHLVFHYSWLFVIAAIPAFSLLPSVLSKLLLIVPLPAAALVFKIFCLNAVCSTIGTPPLNNSFPLYSKTGVIQLLVDEFSPDGKSIAEDDFVIYLNMSTGGGFHFYFSQNYPLRAYLADKPYIRPHDIDPFVAKIKDVRGVLVHISRIGDQEPSAIFRDAFPAAIADALNARTIKSIRKLSDAFVYVEFEKG